LRQPSRTHARTHASTHAPKRTARQPHSQPHSHTTTQPTRPRRTVGTPVSDYCGKLGALGCGRGCRQLVCAVCRWALSNTRAGTQQTYAPQEARVRVPRVEGPGHALGVVYALRAARFDRQPTYLGDDRRGLGQARRLKQLRASTLQCGGGTVPSAGSVVVVVVATAARHERVAAVPGKGEPPGWAPRTAHLPRPAHEASTQGGRAASLHAKPARGVPPCAPMCPVLPIPLNTHVPGGNPWRRARRPGAGVRRAVR
jgi:hypothetical protein